MARFHGIRSLFGISIVLHGEVPRLSLAAAATAAPDGLRTNQCVGSRVRGDPGGVLPSLPSSRTPGQGVAAAFVPTSRRADDGQISHRRVVNRSWGPGPAGKCAGGVAAARGTVCRRRVSRAPDLWTRCGSGRGSEGRPMTERPMTRRREEAGSSEKKGNGGASVAGGDLFKVALSVLAACLVATQAHTLAAPLFPASAAATAAAAATLTSPDPTTGLIPGDDGFGAAVAAASSLARSGAALGDSSAEAQFNAAPYSNVQRGSVRYWDAQYSGDAALIRRTNERLLDHAVGTISNMYYDNSGGSNFNQEDLFDNWKILRTLAKDEKGEWRVVRYRNGNGWAIETSRDGGTVLKMPGSGSSDGRTVPDPPPRDAFSSRLNSVEGLRWLVSTMNDPYSKYLTREELRAEFQARDYDGFLGLGAMVEVPRASGGGAWSLSKLCEQDVGFSSANVECLSKQRQTRQRLEDSMLSVGGRGVVPGSRNYAGGGATKTAFPENDVLSLTRVANLPVVTAVSPNSPAERSGIVVGDRIVAVGSDRFLDRTRAEVARVLKSRYAAENYAGFPDLTIAKPILSSPTSMEDDGNADSSSWNSDPPKRIVGYRPSHTRIATASIERFQPYSPPLALQAMSMASPSEPTISGFFDGSGNAVSWGSSQPISGGNSVCHYQLLTPSDSIFKNVASSIGSSSQRSPPVGYIRLTRFSKSSTDGFVDAVKALDRLGAESYIIDVRNNYGGVVQEAMMTASTLLRDPHEVLCYTLNSRGGFTPQEVEEYIVDARFPGYLLSSEATTVTIDQVKRENPDIFKDGWSPPSSYASLREQSAKRGIRSAFAAKSLAPVLAGDGAEGMSSTNKALQQQKKLVILINEGTASSAEVFASSLRDNGRAVALVGAKTYGKGLIQHTFPMPDGGGLRLTVAEYLTPALKHVTNVGSARYDRFGHLVGGGIKPDIHCDTKGIPSNAGADLCVGLALDAIQDAEASE